MGLLFQLHLSPFSDWRRDTKDVLRRYIARGVMPPSADTEWRLRSIVWMYQESRIASPHRAANF